MATLRVMPGPVFGDVSDAFPAATQLAALGPVLCLYRTQQGSELAGWQQAVRVEVHTGVGSDGLDERLLFFDAQGRCCWRLCLLPDSDFVAWDRLAASLPAGRDADAGGLADRLWRRLAGRLLGGQIVGHAESGKRIDVLATALTAFCSGPLMPALVGATVNDAWPSTLSAARSLVRSAVEL